MKSPSLVRLSLIVGRNDSDPNQQEMQRKLELEAQGWLDSFFTLEGCDCSVLHTLLTAGWLGTHGRKVHFEIGPPLAGIGEVKRLEVANKEELNDLIGNGKTVSTFLRAFASLAPALPQL